MDEDVIHELSESESWEFLASQRVGRLAFHLARDVHLAPVNHAVVGRRIVFRTAEGSKLLGVTMNPDVAFEVDEIAQDQAVSVVVRGFATHLGGSATVIADHAELHPWVPTYKDEVVVIDATEISGRRFQLAPHDDALHDDALHDDAPHGNPEHAG